jgi:hypothetical protein
MNPLTRLLAHRIAVLYTPQRLVALFLVALGFFWLFNFSSLPISNPALMKVSNGEGLLDVRPFYSAVEAYAALTQYGPAGRRMYLAFLAADFVFIPVYVLFFALLTTRTVRAVGGADSPWLPLNLLPVAVGIFDCIENLCIAAMLGVYPGNSFILGTLAGTATSCKWLLTVISVSVLISGGAILLRRRFGLLPCPAPQQGDNNPMP